MKPLKLKHFIVFVFFTLTAPLGIADIEYPDFSSMVGLSLNGDAGQYNDRLRIVPGQWHKVGSAWYEEKQQIQVQFTTIFQFQITDLHTYPADGFAFVIQNESLSALGADGAWIGYEGIPNSLAVEFDIIPNSFLKDPVENHVSVHTNGIDPNKAHHDYSLGCTTQIPDIEDEEVHIAKIDYDSGILSIFIDDLADPVLQVSVDLGSILELYNGRAWVGFTAATGDFYASFDILNWSLTDATGNCLHVPADYLTIQEAIDAAAYGDTVVVAPGTYVENIDFLGKDITVKSSDGAEATVINGGQLASVVTFVNGEGMDSVLSGFTLTNGRDLGIYPMFRGGGITCHNSSPTIMGNIIKNNWGEHHGGGIACIYCSPCITGNIITHNAAGSGHNQNGGGIYIDGNNYGHPIIINNIIAFNTSASYGGGIHCHVTSPTIVNNTIFENTAAQGGGIGCLHSSPSIINTILWGNIDFSGWPEIWEGNQNPFVTFCDVQGGWPGKGNIDADPLFVDPDNGDFHLTYQSACRGSGDNTNSNLPVMDFEGDPRICQTAVDIGADEFYRHLYVTGGKVPGAGVHVNFIGLPGTYPVGLLIGSETLMLPLFTPWGEFHLDLSCPWVLYYPLASIPTDGVMSLFAKIPNIIPAPYNIPMQALIGLNADSLTNLCVLEVR